MPQNTWQATEEHESFPHGQLPDKPRRQPKQTSRKRGPGKTRTFGLAMVAHIDNTGKPCRTEGGEKYIRSLFLNQSYTTELLLSEVLEGVGGWHNGMNYSNEPGNTQALSSQLRHQSPATFHPAALSPNILPLPAPSIAG